ncbi:Protein PTCD3 [Blattella germanica]|nr:Protein PTCD3 [Blattella germanica]
MSNLAKRSFALSKESGRKAAQWIRAQHPELFQHKVAFPFIETFSPKAQYDENSEVNEDILMKLIDSALVSDAVTVYQLLQKKEDGMSQSTKQALLELLCFYNCEDVVPEDMIEERWYGQGTLRRDRPRKTWKDNGMAETLFHSLETKDSAAYCTLLQGMTRFYQVDRAWQLYQEMQEKGIPLTIDAYNSIIRVVCFLRESNDLRWQLIQDLLLAISKEDLQPNIGTLNSSLEAISNMGAHKQVKQYALSVLAELRRVGIEPSLATMDVCRNHLQDIELAHRVHKLLHTGDNYNLIGDSFRDRHYFILFCNMEPLEIFMQFYNQLVPNIYIPESAVMEVRSNFV